MFCVHTSACLLPLPRGTTLLFPGEGALWGPLGRWHSAHPISSLPTDLSKHRRYEIRMSVYNAVGEGPPSPPQEVFVGEAGEFAEGAGTSWHHILPCVPMFPLHPLFRALMGTFRGASPQLGHSWAVTLPSPSAQCPPEHHRMWP